jgi:hypothetical protein
MMFRSLNLNLPPCSYGVACLLGRAIVKQKVSGAVREGRIGHAFLYPEPGCVGPRWLIWEAGPGEYWNSRANAHGWLEGMRVD